MFQSYFQFPNDPVALAEWFVASIVLVVVVTLLYVYVLSKSPPPEGVTVAKLEQIQASDQVSASDPLPIVAKAEATLRDGKLDEAIASSAEAATLIFRNLLEASYGKVSSTMGLSDLAYLVQTRAKSPPQFADSAYNLNNLRLRALQKQPLDLQQASWAVNFTKWLLDLAQTGQIKF